jgi:hypothetical protein
MTLRIKVYTSPFGEMIEHEITDVYPDDDSAESEILVISKVKSCKDMFKRYAK